MSKGIKIVIGLMVAFFTFIAIVAIIVVVVAGGAIKGGIKEVTVRADVAKSILENLANERYDAVYDQQVSSEFKTVADAEVLRDITEATPALDNMTRSTVNSQSTETIDGEKLYVLKGTVYSDSATEAFEIQFVMENGAYAMSYIALGPDAEDEE